MMMKPSRYTSSCILLLWLTLLSTTTTIQAQNYEQRSSTFDSLFQFEVVRGDGNLTDLELQSWSDASSEFFAEMFNELNDENTTTPMLAPGVIIQVTQQDRYVASTGNFGQVNYGVSLEVNFVVTFQTDPEAPIINAANQVLRIFDRDEKGNLIFFSPYLLTLRRNVGNAFGSVNKMSININGPRDIDLATPIPTLPLPPPTDPPVISPTEPPTLTPTLVPTEVPSGSPTPKPTPLDTLPPTVISTIAPTIAPTPVPTMMPTTANPTAPDETFAPTPVPDPTESPTKHPTAAPTLPLESFFATSKLSLVGPLQNLDFNATYDFQEVTANYLSTIIQDLLRDTLVEEVTVGLSSQTLVEPQTTTTSGNDNGGTRRQQRQLQASSPDQEEEPNKLLVEFNTILKIRSINQVNAPSLVQSAFGTAGRRENYRRLLLASQDPILNSITLVELDGTATIDRPKGAVPETSDGGLGTEALVGIAVGATLFAIAILGIWYKANNNNNKSSGDDGDSQKGQIPTAQMSQSENGGLKGRLDAEIVVDKNADDVSTLGDPFFGMSLEERTCADKTATSASVQQSYDFMKLMNKGANALLGTTSEGQEDDEEEETASKVRRNTLFADDDASFEDMFGEMK